MTTDHDISYGWYLSGQRNVEVVYIADNFWSS